MLSLDTKLKVRDLSDSALSYMKKGKLDEAKGVLNALIELDPQNDTAYHYLSLVANQSADYSEASIHIKKAIKIYPHCADYYNTWAGIHLMQNEPKQAINCIEKCLHLNPEYPGGHNNLAMALMELGEHQKALDHYCAALELQPYAAHIHFNYALALLITGRWEQGFKEYEWRHEVIRSNIPIHMPECLEQVRDKRVLLQHEQGLGDTLQFIRYADELRKLGCHVTLACPESLKRILNRNVDSFIHSCSEPCYFDWIIPMMSLPRLFGTTVETTWDKIPYIEVPDEDFGDICNVVRGNKNYKIGLVWGSRREPVTDYNSCEKDGSVEFLPASSSLVHFSANKRCINPDLFVPLTEMRNVRLYSLQKGTNVKDLEDSKLKIVNLDSYITDFSDTAAVITRLDLVITIDTSVAHLAGAMGKKVWLLLPYSSEWRWLYGRVDTPWYPTMKLFRQSEPNNWQEVIERIYWELKKYVR